MTTCKYNMPTTITHAGQTFTFPNWDDAFTFGRALSRDAGEAVMIDARGNSSVVNAPARAWKITRISKATLCMGSDLCIEGENLYYPAGSNDRRFRWYFSGFSAGSFDPRYDASDATIEVEALPILERFNAASPLRLT